MSAEKKLYNFQQILPFNDGPVFPELKGKTVGELSDTQAMQAHEDWIRAQFGHMGEYYRPHLALLLHIIDKFREELVREKGPHIARAFARLSVALDLHEAVHTERESLEEALVDIALSRMKMTSPADLTDRISALVRIDTLVDEIEQICEHFELDPIQWLGDGWQERP